MSSCDLELCNLLHREPWVEMTVESNLPSAICGSTSTSASSIHSCTGVARSSISRNDIGSFIFSDKISKLGRSSRRGKTDCRSSPSTATRCRVNALPQLETKTGILRAKRTKSSTQLVGFCSQNFLVLLRRAAQRKLSYPQAVLHSLYAYVWDPG